MLISDLVYTSDRSMLISDLVYTSDKSRLISSPIPTVSVLWTETVAWVFSPEALSTPWPLSELH